MSNLDPCFRIDSQLVEPLRKHLGLSEGEARAKALDLLARVGIADPERLGVADPERVGVEAGRVQGQHSFPSKVSRSAVTSASPGSSPSSENAVWLLPDQRVPYNVAQHAGRQNGQAHR